MFLRDVDGCFGFSCFGLDFICFVLVTVSLLMTAWWFFCLVVCIVCLVFAIVLFIGLFGF